MSTIHFNKLMRFLDDCSTQQLTREFPSQYLNRNIRDVLAHLYHWHTMFLEWYTTGMKGGQPEMPAKGYTWKMIPALNQRIREQYSRTRLKDIRLRLQTSHEQILKLIDKHTNDELFEKKKYAWTGSTSLGQYLVSATSSHYDWALKLIKKCLR